VRGIVRTLWSLLGKGDGGLEDFLVGCYTAISNRLILVADLG
jgi:hypothetical protein